MPEQRASRRVGRRRQQGGGLGGGASAAVSGNGGLVVRRDDQQHPPSCRAPTAGTRGAAGRGHGLGQWEYRGFEKAIIVLIIVGFYRCLSCVFFWGILSDKNKFWADNWSV